MSDKKLDVRELRNGNVRVTYHSSESTTETDSRSIDSSNTLLEGSKVMKDGKLAGYSFDTVAISKFSAQKDSERESISSDASAKKFDTPIFVEADKDGKAVFDDDAQKRIDTMRMRLIEEEKRKQGKGDGKDEGEDKGSDGRGDTQTVDGGGKEKGFMDKAGDFVKNNPVGLGAGLIAGLAVGAMSGGGLMGMLMALLAMIVVGAIAGNMFDKQSDTKKIPGLGDEEKKQQAMGKVREKEGAGTTVDVAEGAEVQVKNKDKYLSGQDEKGNLKYDSDVPVEVTLRTRDESMNVTGTMTGKSDGTGKFNITSVSTVLPDGRMGPEVETFASLTYNKDGEIDLASEAAKAVRARGAQAAMEYAKPSSIAITPDAKGAATAELGSVSIDVDGDGKNETAKLVASGRMSEDGKKVTLDQKAYLEVDGKRVQDAAGEDMSVMLPKELTQELAVQEGNNVAPMSGDVKAVQQKAVQTFTADKEQRSAKAAEEMKGIEESLDKAENQDQVLTNINQAWNDKLKDAGVENPVARAAATAAVKEMYQNRKEMGDSPDEKVAQVVINSLENGNGAAKDTEFDKGAIEKFAKETDGMFRDKMEEKAPKETGASSALSADDIRKAGVDSADMPDLAPAATAGPDGGAAITGGGTAPAPDRGASGGR